MSTAQRTRRRGRRSPLATAALLLAGLLVTGGAYTAFVQAADAATEQTSTAVTQTTINEGEKLFQSNCATCRGLDPTGTSDEP